jgi:hemerythrin-like metal-binding protein
MFDWKTEYATGIHSIDAQHQTLFAMGRELHAAMSAGQGKTVFAGILDRLVRYTQTHFAHEERLMQLVNYPGLLSHKAEHTALLEQVAQFQADFQRGATVMSVQLLRVIRDWLENHIKGSDLRYVPYMK